MNENRAVGISGGLNLHWQTSFGRNQQKPRQMKKREKIMNKNEHQIKRTTNLQNEKNENESEKTMQEIKTTRNK